MKVAVDVSDLCTARADGTTRYTRELVQRLPKLGDREEWIMCAPCRPAGVVAAHPKVRWAASPWPRGWTQLRFPIDLYRYRPDVLLMPIQQVPAVRPGSLKVVATVHDLAFHRYPQQFAYKDWLLLHTFTAHAVRVADAVIAVSQATADDIAYYYGRTDGVFTVHHGVNHDQFAAPAAEQRAAAWQQLRVLYPALEQPYLLFVGQIQPRKNIGRLIEAFERLQSRQPDLKLVIAGGHGWLQKPIYQRVRSSSVRDRIILLGRVPDDLLPALYWQAEALVLPSFYEGFGMPILEALAGGCPVVTSNTSSLPEVAGGAAVLVDPHSVDSIADGILNALGRREDLIERGRRRVQDFTWEKCARETLDVLRAVAQR